MHTQNLENLSIPASWATIGVFDGVHLGHRQLLEPLVRGAQAQHLPAVVVTFDPHPALVLGGVDLKCLTTPEERAALLFDLGVDVVVTLPFDHALAAQTAEDFMARLSRSLGLKHLLAGYDFALGKGRAGTLPRLREIGLELGYTVETVPAHRRDDAVISSTAIRQDIAEGRVSDAALKLGRLYRVGGPVAHGDGRGRTIGIPTANVETPAGKVIPANGVYACLAWVDGKSHQAVVNIGVRPTFTPGETVSRVEAHLLAYDADIYGKILQLDFAARLRGEQKFSGIDALVAQIRADIEEARKILPVP